MKPTTQTKRTVCVKIAFFNLNSPSGKVAVVIVRLGLYIVKVHIILLIVNQDYLWNSQKKK